MAAPTSPVASPAAAPAAGRSAHTPLRRCVVCRRSAPKAALARIVRTPSGEIRLGGADGRGAYVCRGECAAALAENAQALERALRVQVPPQLVEQISRAYGPGQEAI